MLGDPRMDVIARLMDVSVAKAHVIAANLANQNTPGYRAKAVAFDEAFQQALADGDQDAALSVQPTLVEPRDTTVGVDGNDVDPDRESLAAADNQMKYNAYVAILRGRAHIISTAISPSP